jgi:two-component system response regulator HydG
MKKILVLDDNLTICLMLKSWLVKRLYEVETATNVDDAKKLIREVAFDLVLSDIRMPDMDGFSFLSWIQKYDSDVLVIMMTGYADIESAVASMKSGAVDYISKPIEPELLFKKIEDALKIRQNQKKSKQFINAFIKPEGRAYTELFKRLDKAVVDNTHLLITGDRGTGKASAAKYIYEKGVHKSFPFVTADYDRFSKNGSDAGATSYSFQQENSWISRKFAEAKGGLLFVKNAQLLDKTGQLQLQDFLTKQPKNENFTQVIVSTDKTISELSAIWIPKLLTTLQKHHILLPALKENKESIPFFAHYFLKVANEVLNKKIEKIMPAVQQLLLDYDWPGNIQEVKNTIIKAALLTESNCISEEVGRLLFKAAQKEPVDHPKGTSVKGLRKERYEKEKIEEALTLAKGNKTMAASILNIDRKTLYNKIKLYNVNTTF